MRLTEVRGDSGFEARLGLWPGAEVLRGPGGSGGTLGTPRAVHLVRGRVLADATVAGRRGPERRARHTLASTQEDVEEVVSCLLGRLRHLLVEKP